jgi:hypothetical protein
MELEILDGHEVLDGEVWLDELGEAVIVLPDHLHGRKLEYECRLHGAESTGARAELSDGRLTVTSSAPHRKIAWRLEVAPTTGISLLQVTFFERVDSGVLEVTRD